MKGMPKKNMEALMSQSTNKVTDINLDKAGDEQEIDRIMREIEELEKKVDETVSASNDSTNTSATQAVAQPIKSEPVKEANNVDNVIPFKGLTTVEATKQEDSTEPNFESMAESDAIPVHNEPLMKGLPGMNNANGNLSLKVGGCTEVTLEFEQAGMVVTFQCSEEGLKISTDQGAEFRVPFTKKEAA